MNRNVIVCGKDFSLIDAIRVMIDKRIGSLIVVENGKVVGIVTNRDVMKAIVTNYSDLQSMKVKDIMTKDVITISPSDTLEKAVDLMTKYRIKRLPVVDGDKLVGILTVSDIIVVEPKIIQNLASLLSIKISGYRGG